MKKPALDQASKVFNFSLILAYIIIPQGIFYFYAGYWSPLSGFFMSIPPFLVHVFFVGNLKPTFAENEYRLVSTAIFSSLIFGFYCFLGAIQA